MQIHSNSILITGGTSGIGLAFAERLIALGNEVIICGRRADRLDAIRSRNSGIITRRSDLSDPAQREELCFWALENHPGVNILINNAGIQLMTDLTRPVDLKRIRQEIEINLIAPIHLSSLFAMHLAQKKSAGIINISSGLAFAPLAFMPVYCATKAALHSLSLSLRHQLKNTTVKVFEIIPPSVDTEQGHDRRTDKSQTHGGMDVNLFIDKAVQAIESDLFEAPVGQSEGLRNKREALFDMMNK
jgi:uncharacterized oxidoreductase